MLNYLCAGIAAMSIILSSSAQNSIKKDVTDEDSHPESGTLTGNHTLDEVVVTGQFVPQSLRNSLYKVRVINNRLIQQKASTDVQSLLSTELGVRISNDMTLGESNFELMGMSGNN
ncbi:hypothetical protein EZS27_039946, partial [termite gut metagenome]